MVETALPRGYGKNWIDGSSPRECDDEEDSVRPLPQDNGRKAEERRKRERLERQTERLNRKGRGQKSGERGKEKSWRHSSAYRSLASFASA